MEILLESVAVAPHRICEIVDRFCCKVPAEHGTAPVELDRNASRLCRVLQAGFERGPEFLQARVSVVSTEFLQSGNAGGHCERISAQGPCLVNGPDRRKAIHDLCASP